MKYFESARTWAGSEESLEYVIKAASAQQSMPAPETPSIWYKEGSTAVVNINGPLVQGDAGFMQHFGITGYDNIRNAVGEAVADESVKSIMLSINSGGGDVSGVTEAANFLAEAGKIKPITTYVPDKMASAALWLGVTSQHITAADTSTVGSVGVFMVHTDRSKAIADAGIRPTMVKAGKYKANTNNLEPLSAEGHANLQAQADHLYGIFNAHTANWRGVTPEQADATMTQGRVFTGSQALDIGLVDKIGTYEDALKAAAVAGTRKTTDNMPSTVRRNPTGFANLADNPHQSSTGLPMKPILPSATAAIETAAAEAAAQAAILAAETESASLAAAAALQAQAEAAEAAKFSADVAARVAQASELDSAVVKFLREELSTSQAALFAAQASEQAATKASEKMTVTYAEFEAIVQASIACMAIPMNMRPIAGLTGADLLAEHKRLAPIYAANFKGGRVAAVAPVESGAAEKPAFNAMFAALSTSIPKSK